MTTAVNDACPCCGQSWIVDGGAKADAKRVLYPLTEQMGGQRALLLKYLLDHFDEWTPRRKLLEAVYSHTVHGGSENVIAVLLTHLRRQIEPFGFMIEAIPHRGSRLKRVTP